MRIRLLSLASLLLAGSAAPQQQPQDDVKPPTIVGNVQLVIAPTTVTDRDDRFVAGIQPHEFRVLDNGKLQEFHVDVTFQPIALVVAIQRNSSAEEVLPKVRKIGSLLDTLVTGERGQIAIIGFDHRVELFQDFTAQPERITAALDRLKPGSTSNVVVDASMEAIRILRRRPPQERRVLLLISETRQRGSEGRLRDAMLEAQFHNVSVYTVNMNRLMTTLTQKPQPPRPSHIPPGGRHLPAGAAQTPEAVAAYTGHYSGNLVPLIVEVLKDIKDIFVSNPVEVLTRSTGGKEYSFVTQRALEQAIADIGEELHSQYHISYSPNNKIEGGYHEIKIDIPGRRDLKVRTRPGYWMAGVPQ